MNKIDNIVCRNCGMTTFTILPKRANNDNMPCPCGGPEAIRLIAKYQNQIGMFPQYKRLDVDAKKIVHEGDCFSICFKKLFLYHGINGYEIVHRDKYEIRFIDKGLDENHLYEMRDSIIVDNPNRVMQIKKYFNIDSYTVDNINVKQVVMCIDGDHPIIISTQARLAKWTGARNNGWHSFMIVGYDIKKEEYICVDPSFCNEYQYLPIDIVENNASRAVICDFSNFHDNYSPTSLMKDLEHKYSSLKNGSSADELKKIIAACNFNKPYLDRYNIRYYGINNFPDHVNIYNRFSNLTSFYRYLFEKHREEWLLIISNKYADIYKISSNCLACFVKYFMTGKERDLDAFVKLFSKYADAEREIEEILLSKRRV